MPNQLHSHPRKFGKDSRACRVCNTNTGLIRKYQLMICRRCFREQANLIGFHKYRWGTTTEYSAWSGRCTPMMCGRGPRCLASNETTIQWKPKPTALPTLYTELNFLRLYIIASLVAVWHSFLIRYESSFTPLLLYIVFSNSNFFQLFKGNYSIFLIYLIGYVNW